MHGCHGVQIKTHRRFTTQCAESQVGDSNKSHDLKPQFGNIESFAPGFLSVSGTDVATLVSIGIALN